MVVLDASVMIDFLLDAGAGTLGVLEAIGTHEVAVPHLIDIEVTVYIRQLS